MGFVSKEAWKVKSYQEFTKSLDTLIHHTLSRSVLQSDKLVDITQYFIAKINDDRIDFFSSFYKDEVYCGNLMNNREQLANLLMMWNYNGVMMEHNRQKLCVVLNYDLIIEENCNNEWKHNYNYPGDKNFIIYERSHKFSIIRDEFSDGDENGDEDGKVDEGDDDDPNDYDDERLQKLQPFSVRKKSSTSAFGSPASATKYFCPGMS